VHTELILPFSEGLATDSLQKQNKKENIENHSIIEYLRLEGTHKIIESNSLLLAGLPKTKPYDYMSCPDAP